jgi:iron complex outermembrane receptor protein
LRYVDPLPNPPVPGYTEMDVRLGWRPARGWQIALVLQNLLDASHPEFVGTGVPVEVQRGGYVQATWTF